MLFAVEVFNAVLVVIALLGVVTGISMLVFLVFYLLDVFVENLVRRGRRWHW